MPRKKTAEEFIADAHKVHGDKYDYSKVEYKNSATKICIVCPKHGEFWQIPNDHLRGVGCDKCGGTATLTTEEFISKAKKIHADFYDYSKVRYINSRTKVCIICPVHGEFWQRPYSHLQGIRCGKCFGNAVYDTDRFVKESAFIHDNFYDYSSSVYTGMNNKIEIVCPIHGSFWQKAILHLRGCGCIKCVGLARLTTEEFISRAMVLHKNFYDYSKVKYVNNHTKVCIVCPVHGEFWQTPAEHLSGRGCKKCADEKNGLKRRNSLDDFISRSMVIHGNKYEYSKSEYKNICTKVCIICPEHGEFWQTPDNHLGGQGCPICGKRSKGEKIISEWLLRNNIDYEREFHINLQMVLFGRNKIRVDFYLPMLNTIIEYHGKQHYIIQPCWQTREIFEEQQDRDHRLRKHCKQNGINFIEIPYTEIDNIDKILTKKLL